MTNEQLADFIAQGGNDELTPLLWEKTRKLFRQWSIAFYQKHRDRCIITGVTAEDLFSESYIAMLDAVKGYADKGEGFTFVAFCKYPFMTHAYALVGLRTRRQLREPLNNWESLNAPIANDEGEETERIEFVADDSAQQAFEEVIERVANEQEHELIAAEMQSRLDERQIQMLIMRYWQGKTLKEVSETLEISPARARQLERESLRLLSRSRPLRKLYELNYYAHCSVNSFQKYGSSVERLVEMRERCFAELEGTTRQHTEQRTNSAGEPPAFAL